MDRYNQPTASSILKANLISIAELGETTAAQRKWVLDGLIPEGKPILLGGPPGAGKSLLAQQICMAAHSERGFLVMKPTADQPFI